MASNVKHGPWQSRHFDELSSEVAKVDGGGGPPHDSRMEQRIQRLEAGVTDIRSTMATREDVRQVATATREDIRQATIATREDIQRAADVSRTWGMWAVGTVIATGVALAGLIIAMNSLFMQASGNQLSAFQAGLSTIQAVASARDMAKPPEAPPPTK